MEVLVRGSQIYLDITPTCSVHRIFVEDLFANDVMNWFTAVLSSPEQNRWSATGGRGYGNCPPVFHYWTGHRS